MTVMLNVNLDLDSVRFDQERQTVVVIAQDAASGRVLMVANADREALERTIETGEMHYRSRTRGLWRKGATSGNVQKVLSLSLDCDCDTILARVEPAGPACHTGTTSCFADAAAPNIWSALAQKISERRAEQSASSYTHKLLADRNLRLKKIGEETAELIAALADGDTARSTEEAADLVYHIAVTLEAVGGSLEAVGEVLLRRGMRDAGRGMR